jgi:pectate lyase
MDRVDAVRTFADTVLEHARDDYRETPTPLFVDGLNVDRLQPPRWVHEGEAWIPSNLASHQNLLRTLVGLSALTGDDRYREEALATVETGFHLLQHDAGLFDWGGHRFYDLASGRAVGEGYRHELKHHYPFYELMREVDPEGTVRFIEAFWNAHVLDWGTLDMNRHGDYDLPMGELWDSEFEGAEPFFDGIGLTFINCGSDLIHAGAMHFLFTGEEGALTWAKRLAEQYVRARHPETGLGAYQFSKPKRRKEPPAEGPVPPSSAYGDRAENQFGPEFGEVAREGWMIRSPSSIYGVSALMQMQLFERLGEDGREFLDWTVDGLRAWAEYGYDPEENLARPIWADGTDLTGYEIRRDGYYGPKGRVLEAEAPTGTLLWSYATAHRLTGEPDVWETVRAMARGRGLGEIGSAPGVDVDVNLATDEADSHVLFGLLEICRASDDPSYRDLAARVGDNIVRDHFHEGFFLPDTEHLHAPVNAIEPLALLALEATLRGERESVPRYCGGHSYFTGPHDGLGRTGDRKVIWSVLR